MVKLHPQAEPLALTQKHLPAALSRLVSRLSGKERLAVGEYSYTTTFYLFAIRSQDAPPGCADALLQALMAHGAENGHVRCNLGLCASEGIRFFKTKWGAKAWFPLVEATVEKHGKGLVSRLLNRFRG